MIKNTDYSGAELYFNDDRITQSIGRNGSYLCKGVDFFIGGTDKSRKVYMTGITGKGNAASGNLVVPVADIPELIKVLKSLYELQSRTSSVSG